MVENLFVVDLLKTAEQLYFPELISTFSLSYLSLTFASNIGADGAKSILYSCTKNWKIYSVEIWCEKVKTKVK